MRVFAGPFSEWYKALGCTFTFFSTFYQNFNKEFQMKDFTTGQTAKICKVCPRTVAKWFDSGRLKGYRLPGSKDRRIPRRYLLSFLKDHDMPYEDLEDGAKAKVLAVAQDQLLIENMLRELSPDKAFKLAIASSGFDAGIQAEILQPDCIVVDFSFNRFKALQICHNLRRNTKMAETILITLVSENLFMANSDQLMINDTFRKPFDCALLAARLKTLIGMRKELE